MSVSPDYTEYIDLSIYDKDPIDIVEAGKATLQARIPDWVPSNTNIEVMLMEALAVEVGETIYSLNRLPETMLRVLLALYGVPRDAGTPPTVDVRFYPYDGSDYVIPAGTEVSILTTTGEYMSFYTDEEDWMYGNPRTISCTAVANTNIANGIPSGTAASVIDAVIGVEYAETDSDVVNGALPETVEAWTARGVQVLQRLVSTLVIPEHFTAAALENPLVYRATTIDNYDPLTGPNPGDNPGYVTVAVYGTTGPLTNGQMTTIQSTLQPIANANLIVSVIEPVVSDIDVEVVFVQKEGYDPSLVRDAVDARLREYLNPLSWEWGKDVRVYELVSVIDQVEGVDYVDEVVEPVGNVAVGGPSGLANAGIIAVSWVI
jgi:hypothetical protein